MQNRHAGHDHADHAGHHDAMSNNAVDHSSMDHSSMDHGDHSDMGHGSIDQGAHGSGHGTGHSMQVSPCVYNGRLTLMGGWESGGTPKVLYLSFQPPISREKMPCEEVEF